MKSLDLARPLTCALLVASLLAGCSDDSDDSEDAVADTTTPAATTAPATTTPVAPDTTTASPAPTVPVTEPSGEAAWVLQGHDGTKAVIRLVDADGRELASPSSGVPGGDQSNPDWSPDGTQLTFGVNDLGRDDLWIAGVDGSDPRKAFDCEAPCEYIDDPAWSPDGTSIAVCEMSATGTDQHTGSLVAVDVASGAARVLYEGDVRHFCAGPRWAPDGGSIVMELVETDGTLDNVSGVTLVVADLTSEPVTLTPLTDPALFAATADWNRAGDLIVYSALAIAADAAPQLFTIAPDGSGLRQLTKPADVAGGAVEPSFTIDGSAVVFPTGDELALMRVDLATGAVAPAFTDDATGRHPRSRPPSG